jgi:hypothetical protein
MITNTARTSLLCGLVFMTGFAEAATSKPKETSGKASAVVAAPKPKPATKGKVVEAIPELTPKGQALEATYAKQVQALKAEIEKQLPVIDQAKVAAWLASIAAEEGTAKEVAVTTGAVSKLQKTEIALKQLEESAKKAPKTFAEAKEELAEILAKGESDPELEKLLASEATFQAQIKKEQDQLRGKIEKAAVAAKDAAAKLPEALKASEAAKQAHGKTMAATWKAMDALGTSGILGNNQLDGKLAQVMVIQAATPRGLATFAEKSPEHESLIQQLLANEALMVQMLVADGPTGGKYGEAMKIYTEIQKASPKAKEGLFQRLAVAVSLVHATPMTQHKAGTGSDDAEASDTTDSNGKDASAYVDPVKRYLNYEKWSLDGELDPGFTNLSVWNLTMVVNSEEPDEVYAWGRQMLSNLRPDCVPANGDTSVYVDVVDKEIAYTSAMVKDDRPDLAVMQNILANGGICGRRAFFGRFTLRAFGVPAAARKQPGHATLGHWHPDGWKTRLGGPNWGLGARGFYSAMNDSRTKPYGADVNFVASSQAREDATAFMKVKRAQWIGALVGEGSKPGIITFSGKTRGPAEKKGKEIEKPIFWNDLALQEQRRIIAGLEAKAAPSKITASVAAKAPAATGKITVDAKGVITIPSAACSSPTERTHKLARGGDKDLVVFVKDNTSGETRLHYSRYSTEADSFEYTFDAPKAGKYTLEARVATPKWEQRLFATANGGTPVEMPLPYTIGMWDNTAPVAIELKAGKNVLKFHGPARVTVDTFTLTPAG